MVSLYGKSCEDSGTGKMASGTGRKTAEPAAKMNRTGWTHCPRKTTGRLSKRQVVSVNGSRLCWTTCRIDRLPREARGSAWTGPWGASGGAWRRVRRFLVWKIFPDCLESPESNDGTRSEVMNYSNMARIVLEREFGNEMEWFFENSLVWGIGELNWSSDTK